MFKFNINNNLFMSDFESVDYKEFVTLKNQFQKYLCCE